jgi:hypothetical protein
VLIAGLAAWAGGPPKGPNVRVDADGWGLVTFTELFETTQGSSFETISIDGKFDLETKIDPQPCGAFKEHKWLDIVYGTVDFFELVTVNQPYYTMSAFVDIQATTPEPIKHQGLFIDKIFQTNQLEYWRGTCKGDPYQYLDLDIHATGTVESGTFTLGHSGETVLQGGVPWHISQDFKYDLDNDPAPGHHGVDNTTEVHVKQKGLLPPFMLHEFSTAATVLYDTVDFDAHIYDNAWRGWPGGP